jgi:hypothetical protein
MAIGNDKFDERCQKNRYNEEDDEFNKFNSKAFCIVYSWGWVLMGTVMLVIVAFYELPIATFDLLSDLLNTFQVFIILISLLITYKIVYISEPDIYPFLRKLRVTYRAKKELKKNDTVGNDRENDPELTENDPVGNDRAINDVEAAGHIIGELAKVVVHNLQWQTPGHRSEDSNSHPNETPGHRSEDSNSHPNETPRHRSEDSNPDPNATPGHDSNSHPNGHRSEDSNSHSN